MMLIFTNYILSESILNVDVFGFPPDLSYIIKNYYMLLNLKHCFLRNHSNID